MSRWGRTAKQKEHELWNPSVEWAEVTYLWRSGVEAKQSKAVGDGYQEFSGRQKRTGGTNPLLWFPQVVLGLSRFTWAAFPWDTYHTRVRSFHTDIGRWVGEGLSTNCLHILWIKDPRASFSKSQRTYLKSKSADTALNKVIRNVARLMPSWIYS